MTCGCSRWRTDRGSGTSAAGGRVRRPVHERHRSVRGCGHRVHERHHRVPEGRDPQPAQPAGAGRDARRSRGWGPSLRKGDFLALTILNMQVLTTLTSAQAGGSAIIFDRNDPVGVAEWIRDERVTVWNGPPALIHSLAHDDAVAPDDLASLDEVWNGGGDCPEPVRAAFEEKFGKPVLMTYGLSEAPTVVSIDDVDGGHAVGGSGRPLPHLADPRGRRRALRRARDDWRVRRRVPPDARLLEPRRGHGRDAARRDAAHRRPRVRRRRRLPARPRSQEPGDHPRRRQRVPGRDRAGAARARRGRGVRGGRTARRAAR